MKFDCIKNFLRDIPHMSPEKAENITNFIIKNKITNILELGFCHGTSSLYIAAALDDLGAGTLTTVDRVESSELSPNIESLLERTGLGKYVYYYRENHSYNWFLKKQIESQTTDGFCAPCYDFIFIDGAKDFTTNAATLYLCEKLLKPDGWLLFDDYSYTFKRKDGTVAKHAVGYDPSMGEDELTDTQIASVFHLCAMQHENLGNFIIQSQGWAWAQKTSHGGRKKICYEDTTSIHTYIIRGIKTVFRKLFRS